MKDVRNRWWLEKENVAEHMWSVYQRVFQADSSRMMRMAEHARLYGNRNMQGLAPGSYEAQNIGGEILKYNLVRSVVDTICAKAGRQRPRGQYLTDDGKWSEQQKAKQLNRATYGEFYRAKFYRQLPKIVRDAELFGTGVVKVMPDTNRMVLIERTFPWELFVDSSDGWYGTPRTLYQRKAIDRDVLAEMFPGKRKDIEKCTATAPIDLVGSASVSSRLEVVEAWHLPSSKKAKDGRHVIAVKDILLDDSAWTRQTFPFAFFHYSEAVASFWGDSVVDDIKSQQFELNLTLEKKQEMLSLNVPRTYVNRNAKLSKQHMSDVPGEIVEYSGLQPPIHVAPPGLPPELLGHEQSTKSDAYEIAGISQASATSQKPDGVVAAVAIREVNDIETERFALVSRGVEQFAMDVTTLVVETMKEIAEEDGSYKMVAIDVRGRAAEALDLKALDLDTEAYVLQVYPTGLLPTRPEARMQRVMELVESGIMDATQAAIALDYPDVDAVMRNKLAPYELVDKVLDAMLEKGEVVMPEPFWPLEYALQRGNETYCRTGLMVEGPPEENRELLREFLTSVTMLMKPALDAASGQAQGAPGAPQPTAAAAGAPPQGALA